MTHVVIPSSSLATFYYMLVHVKGCSNDADFVKVNISQTYKKNKA